MTHGQGGAFRGGGAQVVRPAAQEEVALVLGHAGLMERGRAADVLMHWVEPIFVGVLW